MMATCVANYTVLKFIAAVDQILFEKHIILKEKDISLEIRVIIISRYQKKVISLGLNSKTKVLPILICRIIFLIQIIHTFQLILALLFEFNVRSSQTLIRQILERKLLLL